MVDPHNKLSINIALLSTRKNTLSS